MGLATKKRVGCFSGKGGHRSSGNSLSPATKAPPFSLACDCCCVGEERLRGSSRQLLTSWQLPTSWQLRTRLGRSAIYFCLASFPPKKGKPRSQSRCCCLAKLWKQSQRREDKRCLAQTKRCLVQPKHRTCSPLLPAATPFEKSTAKRQSQITCGTVRLLHVLPTFAAPAPAPAVRSSLEHSDLVSHTRRLPRQACTGKQTLCAAMPSRCLPPDCP